MENIRCLIAGIPHIIFADIVQKITEMRPGIEVVDRVSSINNLSQVVKEHAVDVLIFGMEENSISQSLKDIFEMSPEIVTIGVLDDGRNICMCVSDVSPNGLIDLLQTAIKNCKTKN